MLTRAGRRGGFTLIEFVFTLVVIGILFAAVLPMAGTWMQNIRVRNVAEAIQNGMQVARNEAVRRNRSVSFYMVSLDDAKVMDNSCALSNSATSWVVSISSPASKCGSDPSDTAAPMIVSTHAGGVGGDGVTVSAVNGSNPANTLTFNGFGQMTNADGIRIISISMPNCSDCRSLQVEVSATGSVRMCDPKLDMKGSDPRRCTTSPT
ncbi:MAG: prepilin-type N-terminal cleavage/methylation domain-containing protein [Aquabacterium sp.]|nr:MAG: prepilin-type N-terminal cleavage/methylation domain-containing protein [Aquabacterium sp.]